MPSWLLVGAWLSLGVVPQQDISFEERFMSPIASASVAANAAMTDADQQVMNECSDALLKATVSSGVQASSISGELTKALLDHFGVYKE